jgi:hypothetical protein
MAHHLKECSKNMICNALQLSTVEFEDGNEIEPSPTNRFKSVSPQKRLTRSQVASGSTIKEAAKVNPLRIGM